jgi:multiple sugar transport system permease protein
MNSHAKPSSALRTKKGKLRVGESRAALLMTVPFGLLFLVGILLPLGYGLIMSFFTEKRSGLGVGTPETIFVWFGNYAKILADPVFLRSFGTMLLYCAIYIPVIILVPLCLALLVDSGYKWARRTIPLLIFIPHAVPGLMAAIIWAYLYTPSISPVLKALGGAGETFSPFSNSTILIPSLVNIAAWEWIGYNLIIYFTALQALDQSTLEAARVDGAGQMRIAWSIQIPQVSSTTFVVALFAIIGALQLFTEPTLLRSSDPTLSSTLTPSMYAYQVTFTRNDYGAGVAASILIALFAAAISYTLNTFARKKGFA